jgi:hypothetical protein
VWFTLVGLFLAVVGTWSKLRPLLIWLLMIPVRLAFGVGRIIKCPDPLSIQLADAVDGFGLALGYRVHSWDDKQYPRLFTASNVPLTTWLFDTRAAIDSYQRHLALLRKYGGRPHG